MPKPYSQDLRDRVIDAVEHGLKIKLMAIHGTHFHKLAKTTTKFSGPT